MYDYDADDFIRRPYKEGDKVRVKGNSEAKYMGFKEITGEVRRIRLDEAVELMCHQTGRIELIRKDDGKIEKL